jgi:hypothetical protein
LSSRSLSENLKIKTDKTVLDSHTTVDWNVWEQCAEENILA